jgi:lipopolysaccharide/colanic/teichoic acid biosynthesis glycosyltransferase
MANSPQRLASIEEGRGQGANASKPRPRLTGLPLRQDVILNEETLHAMLSLERRRAERSLKPFVLMLLDTRHMHLNGDRDFLFEKLRATVSNATRETDLIGWYEKGVVLAVIFTEVTNTGDVCISETLRSKVQKALQENLGASRVANLVITAHIFPENWGKDGGERRADLKLYPDLSEKAPKKRLQGIMKRSMDVILSASLLLMLSPILAVIALAIKFTSKGPIVFQQERIGQFGKPFKFLKFRSMYVNNDAKIHREFVQSFIAGKAETQGESTAPAPVFKLTKDPRVTAVGRFLRKTSLDELPQFWNVLRGDMSLVGPRPPVAYEFEVYEFWHGRRVLEVQPGVTGLWQVSGRSRTSFDDMVRLDLRYSQLWSVWLDIKILLATPRAVFGGDGAF